MPVEITDHYHFEITYPESAEHILIRKRGDGYRATVQIGEYGSPEYRVARRDGWSPQHALNNAVEALEHESPITFIAEDTTP